LIETAGQKGTRDVDAGSERGHRSKTSKTKMAPFGPGGMRLGKTMVFVGMHMTLGAGRKKKKGH